MNELIFIVDDEPDILELVSINMTKAGYRAFEFENAASLYNKLPKIKPDLIILDLMLPDESGMDICRRLKSSDEYSDIPIIILSAKSETTDKILGLEFGADDYVTKPFEPRELAARVKAVLRRSQPSVDKEKRIIVFGEILEIDPNKFQVKVEGKVVKLTTTEFKILEQLLKKPGYVSSRDKILDKLWGNEKIVDERTVDVHIKHLRTKLGEAGEFIKNIRGVGYKIER
jgi:two-component system phosphate regulon response regulator PhoB/two-component system alkaline phosphatase synthesis response regulator PhoP